MTLRWAMIVVVQIQDSEIVIHQAWLWELLRMRLLDKNSQLGFRWSTGIPPRMMGHAMKSAS